MPENAKPLVQLQPDGTAPVINYNVPEPSIYSGRNYIGLLFDLAVFTEEAKQPPKRDSSSGVSLESVTTALTTGFFPPKLFPNVRVGSNKLSFVDYPNNRLLNHPTQPNAAGGAASGDGASITSGLAATGMVLSGMWWKVP